MVCQKPPAVLSRWTNETVNFKTYHFFGSIYIHRVLHMKSGTSQRFLIWEFQVYLSPNEGGEQPENWLYALFWPIAKGGSTGLSLLKIQA